jgi:FkbM family methyltransferase
MGLLHRASLFLPRSLRERLLTYRWGIRSCLALRKVGLSIFSPLVIFDVGANNGNSFLPAARWFRRWRVTAFEPTPELVALLQRRAEGLSNYQVIPNAVSENPGKATFNVDSLEDWGCSSLLEFNEARRETWADRHDLEVTHRIEVEVIRLDRFIDDHGVKRIDYLHIDTQGSDLRVLRSLGDKLAIVQAGVMEVPVRPELRLYNDQHTKEEALAFLGEAGFVVVDIDAVDNEANVYFRRP